MLLLLVDVICFLLVIAASVRCCYCIFCVIPLLRLAEKGTLNLQSNIEVVLPPISVIICAKNEATNLQQYLPHVLLQNYHQFEVVVVNDASTDETLNVLSEFKKKHAHLKVVTILQAEKTTMGGKRQALQAGIEHAQHNYLLLTDADCYPSSNLWIELMAKHFANGKEIVLGYGPYLSQNGWLSKVVAYETLHTAMRYLSCALAGMPYMGVGRNLAYTKQLFYKSGGFDGQTHLTSGDDDLLVNKAATSNNTAIEIHRDAFCYSPPPSDWSEWYRQKARHLGAGKHYSTSHLLALGVLTMADVLFYGMIIASFLSGQLPLLLTGFCLFTIILNFSVYAWATRVFKTKGLIWFIPLFDVIYPVYYLLFAPFILTAKKISWN